VKTILTVLVTLISGGAMGALITQYWTNRQTVVTYTINTTSIGAGEATRSVLPTLKLQLGDTEIPVVYTHTIDLVHDSGPELDQATVGVTFLGANVLGTIIATGPDPVHPIACKTFDPTTKSIVCGVGRVSSGSDSYKIVVATDRNPEIKVTIDAKNSGMRPSQPASKSVFGATDLWFLAITAIIVSVNVFLGITSLLDFRAIRRLKDKRL
jgi:hypothetical protein